MPEWGAVTMSEPAATAPSGTRAVLIGGALSGVAAYAFTILGTRALGEVAYAPVGVLWTLQYLILTVGLLSLEAFVTREGVVTGPIRRWIAVLVAGLLVAAFLTGPRLFGSSAPVWAVTTGLLALGFSTFVVERGLAAARGDFRTYAVLTGGESLVRLLVAGIVVVVWPTAEAMALTLPAGVLAMTVLSWSRRRRRPRSRAVTPVASGVGRFLASTTLANAVAQMLLAGGPLLTALVGAAPAVTSQVFVTTTAARAPLVLLYSGLLARLLPAVRGADGPQLRRMVARSTVLTVGLAVVGAGIAWAVGPWLVSVTFGPGLAPGRGFAALTAASVVLAVALLSANQVLIAVGAADRLPVPWVVAFVAGLGVAVALRTAPDLRAGLATLVGLAVAAAGVLPRVWTVGESAVAVDGAYDAPSWPTT